MSENALICRDISVRYPEFTLQLDFSITKGEFVSIIGPSGCGKSTTLQLITGLLNPEEGSIILNGTDITQQPVWKRKIAMVFQDYALFPHLNVEKNVAYSLKLQKNPRKQRIQKVNSLLALVGLTGYERRKVTQLSGGERQRVALARALASDPALLLLDEPLSALDAKLRQHLRQELRKIHDETNITTLYVTHDQEEALSLSDRILVLNGGRMEQLATPEEVYTHPATLFAATFMGEGTLLPYDVIPTTLVSQQSQHSIVVFRSGEGVRQIFFRPERVLVHERSDLAFPEFLPHLRFSSCKIIDTEYQGGRYLLRCRWQGHTITAFSRFLPKASTLTLGVRLSDLTTYVDGVIANS